MNFAKAINKWHAVSEPPNVVAMILDMGLKLHFAFQEKSYSVDWDTETLTIRQDLPRHARRWACARALAEYVYCNPEFSSEYEDTSKSTFLNQTAVGILFPKSLVEKYKHLSNKELADLLVANEEIVKILRRTE